MNRRDFLKQELTKCTNSEIEFFKKMYSPSNLSLQIEEVIDNMPAKQLNWAVQQISNTLKPNKNRRVAKDNLSPYEINAKRAEDWKKLKEYIVTEINKIDRETVCEELEPTWWVEMAGIRDDLEHGSQIPKA